MEHDFDAERKERTILAMQGDPRYAGWLEFTAWVISLERENAKREREFLAAYGGEER